MAITDLAIQPDGKIIGAADVNGTTALGICRLNTDGTADSSFSNDGVDTISIPFPDVMTTSLLVQLDGKIALGGYGANYNSANYDGVYAIARYTTDGEIDSSFSNDGVGMSSVISMPYTGRMTQQIDGKYIIAGVFDSSAIPVLGTARFNNGGGTAISKVLATKVMSLQLYPNPVSQTATASYELTESSIVSVWLTDLSGRKILDIITDERRNIGHFKQMVMLPEHLASGIYMLHLKAGRQQVSIKLIK